MKQTITLNPLDVEFVKKVLNGVFQARKRLARIEGTDAVERALDQIEEAAGSYAQPHYGYSMHDPTNERYSDTRTDVQASLSGESSVDLRIVETMKPIISVKVRTPEGATTSIIIQQGVVVVRGADGNEGKKQ